MCELLGMNCNVPTYLLEAIRRRFREPPTAAQLRQLTAKLADEIVALGRFNFLICDARYLYAYCTNKLWWIQRRAPFSRAALINADLEVDFSQHATPRDEVVVVAMQPLTRDETWTRCRPAELSVFGNGEPIQLGGPYA